MTPHRLKVKDRAFIQRSEEKFTRIESSTAKKTVKNRFGNQTSKWKKKLPLCSPHIARALKGPDWENLDQNNVKKVFFLGNQKTKKLDKQRLSWIKKQFKYCFVYLDDLRYDSLTADPNAFSRRNMG